MQQAQQQKSQQSHLAQFENEEEELAGQLQTWDLIFGFVNSMALRAACILRIPDILARDGPLTLEEIAFRLDSPAPRSDYLSRILSFLCTKGVFSLTMVDNSSASPQPIYGLTPVSKWLLQGGNTLSLLPILFQVTHRECHGPWYKLSDSVLQDGQPLEKEHGMDGWSFLRKNPDLGQLFNTSMASVSEIILESLLKHYHGFANVQKLVDVAGGIGATSSRIVARYPSITAINYDLPHVVASAPSYPGIEHVGGDMFKSVPSADTIMIKWALHNWDDEACIQILKNCRNALPSETGRLIIVDAILEEGRSFSDQRRAFDLLMLTCTSGGKERSKEQWEALLRAAGFARYQMIDLPCLLSVIEAFPAPHQA